MNKLVISISCVLYKSLSEIFTNVCQDVNQSRENLLSAKIQFTFFGNAIFGVSNVNIRKPHFEMHLLHCYFLNQICHPVCDGFAGNGWWIPSKHWSLNFRLGQVGLHPAVEIGNHWITFGLIEVWNEFVFIILLSRNW